MGKTIFFSSHLLYEVSEIADKIAIINNGHLLAFDTMEVLEAKVKSSLIRLEVLNANGNSSNIISRMIEILRPYIDQGIMHENITFSNETRQFNINFDGDSKHQFEILKILVNNDIEVVEYSVPKAGLLEDLYMNLVTDTSQVQFAVPIIANK